MILIGTASAHSVGRGPRHQDLHNGGGPPPYSLLPDPEPRPPRSLRNVRQRPQHHRAHHHLPVHLPGSSRSERASRRQDVRKTAAVLWDGSFYI